MRATENVHTSLPDLFCFVSQRAVTKSVLALPSDGIPGVQLTVLAIVNDSTSLISLSLTRSTTRKQREALTLRRIEVPTDD